jgi:hypothetical protein
MYLIELRPHVGRKIGSKKKVVFAQDMVFLNKQHIGYLGHGADAPLNLVTRLTEQETVAVMEYCGQQRGGHWPPKVSQPPEVPGEEADTWVDEDLDDSE